MGKRSNASGIGDAIYECNVQETTFKEYDMLRGQIDNAIARMDKYNIEAMAVLLLDVFFNRNVSIFVDVMGLLVALFFLLKIIECRNMVAYNATYLTEFVENKDLGLMYESRVQKLRGTFWNSKKAEYGGYKKLMLVILQIGYKIKYTMIGIFALVVLSCFVIRIWPLNSGLKVFKVVILSAETFVILLYTFILLACNRITGEFKVAWNRIKDKERQR